MKPSWIQMLFASPWFNRLFLGLPAACAVVAFWTVALSRSPSLGFWDRLLMLVSSPVAGLVVLLAMLIVGSIVLPPVSWLMSWWNGGPFKIGDRVRVIGGRYRGTVGRVYGESQGNSVRVDVGDDARRRGDDLFIGHELMRVRDDAANQA